MVNFLSKLFDTSDFPARWYCGNWTTGHGWLHILSDLGVWAAYMTIPLVLGYFALRRRRDLPFPTLFWLFAAFITACGTTHLLQALIFWWPVYRLAGLVTLATALLSWSTVIALVFIAPKALALRTPLELEGEVRTRTVELTSANMALQAEARERRKSEDERDRLAAIVESSEDAVVGETPDGVVTDWNRGAEKLFGYEAAEMVGRPVSRIVPPERLDELASMTQRLRDGETTLPFETVRIRKDGSRVHVSVSVSPVRDAEGRLIGISKIARDVSARVAAEEALREAGQRKDEFLAMLGHELRNPLAPVRSGLAVLRCLPDGPEKDEVVTVLERQTEHLVRLVDDLLDVSRVMRGQFELRTEPVEVAEAIRRAVEIVRPEMDAAGHWLSVEVPQEPLRVKGDLIRLVQAIANLLQNAAKYTPPGGRVWLSAERIGDRVQIRVRDTGVGVEPTVLPQLFDLFVQEGRTTERSQGGLGVGLTVVKHVVERHGGSVTAHSEGRGLGSEFSMSLPLLSQVAPPAKSAIGAHCGDAPGPRRVLVIEDNVAAAKMLEKLLGRIWGHEVQLAHDGESGIQAATAFNPELVICDIGLPGADGYEVARRLRQSPKFRETVLVALTGYGTEADRQQALDAGFDEHLPKPASVEMLRRLSAHPKLLRLATGG